ncbi:MAG TPA: hypothetical protein DCE41_06940 [Cytophagales bacterium]|nr:hypothetical protein [Cytophagales bacterium]
MILVFKLTRYWGFSYPIHNQFCSVGFFPYLIFTLMRYFSIIFFCLLGITYTHEVHGQILNVEDVRAQRDTTKSLAGNLGLDFMLNNRSATAANQVQFLNFRVNANLALFGDNHALWFINLLNYSALTGNPFIRTGYSHVRYSLHYKRKLGWEAFGQAQYDLGRGLRQRFLGGGGVRYNLVNQEKLELHAGVGGMYEYERWRLLQTDDEVDLSLFKSTNYFSVNWLLWEGARLHMTNYYQVGLDQNAALWRHRLSVDMLLQLKLTERLAFRVSVDAAYENRPIISISPYVYTVTNGIMVAF